MDFTNYLITKQLPALQMVVKSKFIIYLIMGNASTINASKEELSWGALQLEEIASMLTHSGHTCKSPGLSYGKMGIVIFLFHYARQTQDHSSANTAENLIDEIQAALHLDFPISYDSGLTGIGTGIEYLAQQSFLDTETDEALDDFDQAFVEQIHLRKLYLSYQDIQDMKRYFLARLENPRTKKRDFLNRVMNDIVALLELRDRVRVNPEEFPIRQIFPDTSENWGLEGLAGKGLALLSTLNPQHKTWLTLKQEQLV